MVLGVRLFLKHPRNWRTQVVLSGQICGLQLLSIGPVRGFLLVIVEHKKRGDPCPKLMHKTNSAVVEQYAFPFVSPPVNRVPPSSETDSEQEGFLYHAVVPPWCQGESRLAKSLNWFFLKA